MLQTDRNSRACADVYAVPERTAGLTHLHHAAMYVRDGECFVKA